MCDVVYSLFVDRIVSDQQAILTAALMAGAEVPSLDERLAEFDKALAAAPKVLDPEELELRIALGVRTRAG